MPPPAAPRLSTLERGSDSVIAVRIVLRWVVGAFAIILATVQFLDHVSGRSLVVNLAFLAVGAFWIASTIRPAGRWLQRYRASRQA